MNTSLKMKRNQKESLSSAEKISSIAGHNSPRTKSPRSPLTFCDLERNPVEQNAPPSSLDELS